MSLKNIDCFKSTELKCPIKLVKHRQRKGRMIFFILNIRIIKNQWRQRWRYFSVSSTRTSEKWCCWFLFTKIFFNISCFQQEETTPFNLSYPNLHFDLLLHSKQYKINVSRHTLISLSYIWWLIFTSIQSFTSQLITLSASKV